VGKETSSGEVLLGWALDTASKFGFGEVTSKDEETGDTTVSKGLLNPTKGQASISQKTSGKTDRQVTQKEIDEQQPGKPPKDKTSHSKSIGAKADFADSGGKLKVDAGLSRDGLSVGSSLTIGDSWKLTRVADEDWKVTWIGDLGASVKMGKGAASVGANVSESRTYETHFPTEKEARSFLSRNPVPPAAPGAMRVGDQAAAESAKGVSAGLSTKLSGVKLGATVTFGNSVRATVSRKSENEYLVQYIDLNELGGSLSAGSPVMTMEFSKSAKDWDFHEVLFDLSVDGARNSFDKFRSTGALSGTGYQVIKKGNTRAQADAIAVMFPLASAKVSSEVSSTTQVDGQGNATSIDKGTSIAKGASSLPLMKGQHNESHEVTFKESGGKTTVTITSKVDTSDADAAGAIMANVANSGRAIPGGSGTGAWTIEIHATKSQMEAFAQKIQGGDYKTFSLYYKADVVRALRSGLNAASEPRQRYQALAKFFSKTGDAGIKFLQETIGELPVSFDLAKAKDPHNVWLSGSEVAAYKRSIGDLSAKVAEPDCPEEAKLEVATKLSELQLKVDKLKNDSAYKEVPRDVKKKYGRRLAILVKAFTELQRQVDNNSQADPAQQAFDRMGRDLVTKLEKIRSRTEQWRKHLKACEQFHGTHFRPRATAEIIGESDGDKRDWLRKHYKTADDASTKGNSEWDKGVEWLAKAKEASLKVQSSAAASDKDEQYRRCQVAAKETLKHLQEAISSYSYAENHLREITVKFDGALWNKYPARMK